MCVVLFHTCDHTLRCHGASGVDDRAGGVVTTSWDVEASLQGESAKESIVDNVSERKFVQFILQWTN